MITEVLLFIFFWFTMCGLWHETMHLLECKRQKIVSSYMWIDFDPLPSLHYTHVGVPDNHDLLMLSGGLYTSILCFVLSLIFVNIYWFLGWVFLTLGWVQFVYGIFEMLFITKTSSWKYFIYRYMIYSSIVLLSFLLLLVIT